LTKELTQEEKDMATKMMQALKGTDEWEKALKPMITNTLTKNKLEEYISQPKSEGNNKTLEAFKTHTFLDKLYLNSEGKSINGIPMVAQIGITGLPSSGKSILIEEIAVQVAHNGKKVLLVTSEDSWESVSPRFDLQSRLRQKAEILKLNWDKICENLIVLDTVTRTELRSWSTFAETYRYVVTEKKIDLVLIDSVTLLETYRGALKFRLQELSRFNQQHGITALFVNQRATEDWDKRSMAGGIGIGHILDSTIIVDYGKTYHSSINADLGTKRGTDVKIVRVLGCRLCGFNGNYHQIDITKDGLLRLI